MIPGALCGALAGLGVLLVWRGLVPPRPPLAAVLARSARIEPPVAGPAPEPVTGAGPRLLAWATRCTEGLAARLRLGTAPLRRDLRVLGRSLERHAAEKLLCALGGLALVPATVAVMELGGVSVPWVLPTWAALALGAAGFVLPDVSVRREAALRRRDLRFALGSFLDLVEVRQAGGAGMEGALVSAARVGHGMLFAEIRRALDTARRAGRTPWEALERLGDDLGLDELVQLAASVALADEVGASVRRSLAAKASSLRARLLNDARAASESASTRMALPLSLLAVAFMAFITFPAVARVLTAL